jgi:hypothetical protein
MKNEFKIRICSDLDYEEMVADVCFEDKTIATVTQESGIDNMKIEFFGTTDIPICLKLPLDHLIEALQLAKKELIAFGNEEE